MTDTSLLTTTEPAWGRLSLAIKRAAKQFFADGALTSGAAMSFYLALCLSPLVMVVLAVVNLVWGEPASSEHMIKQAQQFVGAKGAQTIQKMIADSEIPDMASLLTGLLVGLFGATGTFVSLQQALDCIYEVAPDPNRSRGEILWDRLVSIVMVVLIGLMLLVSLAATTALAAVNLKLHAHVSGALWIAEVLEFLLSLAIIWFLFACIFKFLPHTQISWRKVWLGALVTAGLFKTGELLAAVYLGWTGVDTASEAAAAIVVIVIWEYYSALSVFFGAELTQTYTGTADQGEPAVAAHTESA